MTVQYLAHLVILKPILIKWSASLKIGEVHLEGRWHTNSMNKLSKVKYLQFHQVHKITQSHLSSLKRRQSLSKLSIVEVLLISLKPPFKSITEVLFKRFKMLFKLQLNSVLLVLIFHLCPWSKISSGLSQHCNNNHFLTRPSSLISTCLSLTISFPSPNPS